MKILSIVGARPQFVKVAVLGRAFAEYARQTGAALEHRLMHTGQHHDAALSDIFFEQLAMPKPHYSLGIGSGKHSVQTAAMMASIEACLEQWRPDMVVVYGDTNSTLAGALAAVKMHIPLAHLEAGLRSFDRRMPEEINRIVSDHVSNLLLCPTATAMENLRREGRAECSVYVGDVMLDAVRIFAQQADDRMLRSLKLEGMDYALVTLHRAANTDDQERLNEFVKLLADMPIDVVLPMHPRLKKCLGDALLDRLQQQPHVHLTGPASYLEMLALEQRARMVMTDSGGVQKEAYFLGARCLTLRDETEWIETLKDDWNQVLGLNARRVLDAVCKLLREKEPCSCAAPAQNFDSFGGGHAGKSAVEAIFTYQARVQ